MNKKVFLICPVRNATEEQKMEIQDYIAGLERQEFTVYYPARDTDQNDEIGFRICTDNKNAIVEADEIHVFYDTGSAGSLFDLGMAFALNKKLVIANTVKRTETKSFANVIVAWSEGKK